VRFRFQPWQLAAALVLLCAAVLGVLEWRRSSQHYDASRLMRSLPVNGAVKVYIDVEGLRDGGLLDALAGPKAAEDPDYRHFADEIGFDYRTDLDAVAAAFVNGDFYAAARGHFDWKRLTEYARSQQGQCTNGICNLPGSETNRIISFYPLSTEVLALAVSDKPQGVMMIAPPTGKNGIMVPASAFWISAPGSDFKNLKNLPVGTQSFMAPLAQAKEAAFSVRAASAAPGAPTGSNSSLEIRMDVACVSPDAAAAMSQVFSSLTDVLRRLVVSEHVSPKPSDLTAVLVSGRFEVHESNVTGFWPMDRRVIESLVSDQAK
jgi:hypothetical protein